MKQNYMVTSIKVPQNLHSRIIQQMIEDGYGQRGKSKWVVESISAFLELSYYLDLVDISIETTCATESLCVRLPEELVVRIDRAVIEVRKRFPDMEGVRSSIIRAGIFQRLLRKLGSNGRYLDPTCT